MATNSARLQNIFDGVFDSVTPQQTITDRIDDVVLLADEKEFSDFFLPAVITKETASVNQKRAWLLHKFWQSLEGWRKHAKRTRRQAVRDAEDIADP